MFILQLVSAFVNTGSKDYRIIDLDDAFITPVKMLACTVIDLLADGASGAAQVKENFKPEMTKDAYIQLLMSLEQNITYKD